MRHNLIMLLGMFLIGFGTAQSIGFLSVSPHIKNPPSQSIVASITPGPSLASVITETVVVSRVIDGDTIELTDSRKVRYIGIDTPETVDPRKPVQCFGPEASMQNKQLVEGKTVQLEKDVSQTDKYGRLLRYIYIGGVMVNEQLIKGGFAHSSTYPPDVKYQEQFRSAEAEARESGRGLWKECTSFNPTNTTNNPIRPINETMQQLNNSMGNANDVAGVQAGCTIKGNISASGDKIYHVRGCGSYEKTSIDEARGEKWFCSEDEAVKAGWRKAKNC